MLAMVAKWLIGDWYHPAPLFCALWAVVCGVAIAVAPENITSASAPLWILLNSALVLAGGIIGTAFAISSARRRERTIIYPGDSRSRDFSMLTPTLRRYTIVCTVLGVFYIVFFLKSQNISIMQLTDFRALLRSTLKTSINRYTTTTQVHGLYLQLLLSVSYLAPLLGGTLFILRKIRLDKTLAIVSLVPSVLAFATQSTRSSVVYALSMWITGLMVARVFLGKRADRLNRRALALAIIAVPAGLLLISVGDILRTGGARAGTVEEHFLSGRTKTYMCGHLAALSQWMDTTDLRQLQPTFGQYSLSGAYEMLNPGTRVGGVISELQLLPTGPTNVYTYFRGLIQDATLWGSLAVIFVLAIFGGYAYRRVSDKKVAWTAVLAACYGGILLVLTSIFNYNSMILAFALYGVLWVAMGRRMREIAWAH